MFRHRAVLALLEWTGRDSARVLFGKGERAWPTSRFSRWRSRRSSPTTTRTGGAAKEALAVDMVYDEAATQRRIKGVEEVLSAWKGWAKAFPDSRASFDKETVSGNTAIIEVTW